MPECGRTALRIQRTRIRVALVGLIVGTFLVVLLGVPVAAAVGDVLAPSDGVTLGEGLMRTVDSIHATAGVYPDVHFVTEPGSADPAQAAALRNNYSVFDQSNAQTYPGYNDCDAWSNLFRDGWSASYTMTASLDGGQTEDLILAVDRYWRDQGFDVQRFSFGEGPFALKRVTIDLAFSQLQLDLDPRRDVVTFTGTTACLSPQ